MLCGHHFHHLLVLVFVKRRSPLTGCLSLRLGAGCWVGVGGGISRAAAHRLCGGRSWQLLGFGRWLRGSMGLHGLAVFDLQWRRRRRKGLLREFLPPSISSSSHIDTVQGRYDEMYRSDNIRNEDVHFKILIS